ncbi:MAG TPA: hypothetical protein ENK87_00045 [Nitratifractor sp.]|nr:hypothetical protein [Nitratifractor sp.]HHD74696.1 hypothetical protein [Nitratifractor sp.]HHH20297.1 hypothetical protein [Nitratifractor sp.]
MKLLLILSFSLLLFAKDTTGLLQYGKELNKTISQTDGKARDILLNAYKFVENKRVIKGSCWDYINTLYKESNASRQTVFKSQKKGPYVDLKELRGGDWIYHINHSYHNIEHSGLFVRWIDRNNTLALMLSYAGEDKKRPARFRAYNINKTYKIMRAKESNMEYISQKEYAKKNKMSLFNTMKLAKSGKVETITKTIDGKEQLFIKSDAQLPQEPEAKKVPTLEELYKEIEELKARVKKLEEKKWD